MTEYIMNLRKTVGTQPLMQCGATVIVFDDEDRVLMLRRTDNECWCFPGGSIDLGERVEETAQREVREEAGIYVEDLRLLNVFSAGNCTINIRMATKCTTLMLFSTPATMSEMLS